MFSYMQTAEITYCLAPYPGEAQPLHTWAWIEDGQPIARLWADPTTGEIMNVETNDDRQGEGLASALYARASETVDLRHAPESHRTESGDRFAKRVGGEALPCQHGCCASEEN